MGGPNLLLLLIASALYVSSSPSTTTSPQASQCHTEDSTWHENCEDNGDDDPLTRFWIVYPEDGAAGSLPIAVRLGVSARSTQQYEAHYGDAQFCVELNQQWKKCKTLEDPSIVYDSLPEGNYTAIAYIADKGDQQRYHASKEVTFTLLSPSEYNLYNEKLAERSRKEQQFPEDVDLLRWTELEQQEINNKEENNLVLEWSRASSTSSPMLVIGVKTAVVTNFPRRQAIRDSWAHPASLPHDVKVLFLGCEPDMTVFQNDHDQRRILHAVAKEREIYGDVLTEELGCTDSYKNLANKVKAFLHLAAAEFPDASFVMVADDDIYLKADQLAEFIRGTSSKEQLYLGEVWSVMFSHKQAPIRDSESKYYIPEGQYPMRGLLPYVSGPHFVVSMDGVRFVAKNYRHLSSMNGLDDVSVGLWLRTIQVQAQHTSDFSSVRAAMKCEESLVSLADLSPLGIRSIHANLVNNRSFCHGFNFVAWHRNLNKIPSLDEILQRPTQETSESSNLQLEVYIDDPDQVTVIVSNPSRAGMKLQFISSDKLLDDFNEELCTQVGHHFPTSPVSCQTLVKALYDQLRHHPGRVT